MQQPKQLMIALIIREMAHEELLDLAYSLEFQWSESDPKLKINETKDWVDLLHWWSQNKIESTVDDIKHP